MSKGKKTVSVQLSSKARDAIEDKIKSVINELIVTERDVNSPERLRATINRSSTLAREALAMIDPESVVDEEAPTSVTERDEDD